MNWVMPTRLYRKMHVERFLQSSVPNVPVVQCSSQMSVLSTGVCILETLSFGLRRTPIFTKSWREAHLTLQFGLDWVQHTIGPFFFHGSVTGQAYHDMLSEWLVPQLHATSGHQRHCCPAIGWSTTTLCLAHAWLSEWDLSRVVDWKRFRSFTRSLCLAPKKSQSDNTR
jgi:hypothetical protein